VRFLTLGDLRLCLEDLFNTRKDIFLSSKICLVYEPLFSSRREQLNVLPKSLVGGVPLTEELAAKDKLHDDSLLTILGTLEASLKSPRASELLKKAAREIIEVLKLSAADTMVSYPQEAINAKNREETITKQKDNLQLFKLPEGGSLYDIAQDYLLAAKGINALLSERAKQESLEETDRREVPQLRVQIIAEIGRCRAALVDELKTNGNLPNNIDSQIFGYFDDLQQQRAIANHSAHESKSKHEIEVKSKAAKDAKEYAIRAQLEADQKTREAEELQRLAQEAKELADK
jgi:hypothetical protein